MNDDDLVRTAERKLRAATIDRWAYDAIERLQAERDAAYAAGESNMQADFEVALDAVVDDEFEVWPSTVAALVGRLQAELAAANEEIALLRGDDTGADARATYWQARCHALERDRARIEQES